MGLDPTALGCKSERRATWKCNKHGLFACSQDNSDSPLCSCSGLRVCLCQSLAARRPDLMRQWDFKANTGMEPTALGCNSERRATWKCRKHGPWVTQIQVRTQESGPGCPGCAQVVLPAVYSLPLFDLLACLSCTCGQQAPSILKFSSGKTSGLNPTALGCISERRASLCCKHSPLVTRI